MLGAQSEVLYAAGELGIIDSYITKEAAYEHLVSGNYPFTGQQVALFAMLRNYKKLPTALTIIHRGLGKSKCHTCGHEFLGGHPSCPNMVEYVYVKSKFNREGERIMKSFYDPKKHESIKKESLEPCNGSPNWDMNYRFEEQKNFFSFVQTVAETIFHGAGVYTTQSIFDGINSNSDLIIPYDQESAYKKYHYLLPGDVISRFSLSMSLVQQTHIMNNMAGVRNNEQSVTEIKTAPLQYTSGDGNFVNGPQNIQEAINSYTGY
jgi:hypothetical protein